MLGTVAPSKTEWTSVGMKNFNLSRWPDDRIIGAKRDRSKKSTNNSWLSNYIDEKQMLKIKVIDAGLKDNKSIVENSLY